ncbi:MAG: hypothetical protein DHS20C17_10100 [Cyclobacteriaceae bacterium]|nr:MAG: hypothetical protein DHS20C17_10100 [Cyclobacteriaceae bacterium]
MDALKPGSLAVHLVGFCRFLRSKGFIVGPREESEMFQVLENFDLNDIENFQLALAQLLCKSRQQQLDFADYFEQFWQELFKSFNAKVKLSSKKSVHRKKAATPTTAQLKNWLHNNRGTHTEETAFYSGESEISGQDLSHYQSESVNELVKLVNQIAHNWQSRPGRRKVKSKSPGQIDLRQVLRRNLSTGEMINIAFRENKLQKPRLVLVCDISKSMEVFTGFSVQLLYAFQNSYRSLETFMFGSELHHVTNLLKQQSFNSAMQHLSSQVPDWSGGTRIGYCLDRLIRVYGSRMLHGRVIFLMISDGWDTGDIELLESSMQYINRKVKQLIWLNPHASKPGFQPRVQGMVAALPYIDYLHGVHDVESLKDLRSKI